VGLHSVETRQKAGVLFETSVPLKAGASIGLGPAEVDGYSQIGILVLSDQSFVVSLFEAEVSGGPYVLSQTYTAVSSSNVQSGPFPLVAAGPGFMVAQRFFVTGSFLKATIQNTSAFPETILSARFLGIPEP
jgi:hypothetical protein